MRIKGVIRTAELREHPPASERIEMHLGLQGVGPGQPRSVVVPYSFLLHNDSLDPDEVTGRGFEAEVAEEDEGRWVVSQIGFASKVLRTEE